MDAVVFRESGVVPDAVELCFERICEAAKKLGILAEELCPDIRWNGIVVGGTKAAGSLKRFPKGWMCRFIHVPLKVLYNKERAVRKPFVSVSP
jgi:hypothetical protein